MKRLSFALTATAIVTVTVGIGWGIGQFRKNGEPLPPPAPGMTKRGELLYQTNCASCHGSDGRGDGTAATMLKPPPRDFAVRPWRFEPTKDSIRKVIVAGIPGTAMPASRETLSDADVDALTEYVYILATSRPPIAYEPSQDENRLKAAGFVDLKGNDAPPLTVSDGAGKATKLTDLRGRLVIVNFWGTTCVHCLIEMPGLHKLEAEYANRGLTVLHVCADADDAKTAQALLDKHVPGVRGLTDESGLSLARFEVQTLPTAWLIGIDGKAIGRASGSIDWRSPNLVALIEHWLPRS